MSGTEGVMRNRDRQAQKKRETGRARVRGNTDE
jgi:hypothetical protein